MLGINPLRSKQAQPSPSQNMPELPEVEVTRLGLAPSLLGAVVSGVICRTPRLRYPLPSRLGQRLGGHSLQAITRRGKYLLFD